AVIGPPQSGGTRGGRNLAAEAHVALDGGRGQPRDLLLPALHAVQPRFGWLPPGALNYVSQRLEVPPAETYGVATFYHLFSLTALPLAVAHVCDDIACRIHGGEQLCLELATRLGSPGKSGWKRSACLGQCEHAPAALVVQAGETPRSFVLAPAESSAVAAGLDSTPPPGNALESLRRSVPQSGSPGLCLLGRI